MKRLISILFGILLPYFASLVYGIWLSPDPSSDKYPEISPYAYCGWNPITFLDPDGREKYIYLNPKGKDNNRYNAALNYVDNIPAIHIWAHGDNHELIFSNDKGILCKANTIEKLVNFLNENVFSKSKAWQKHLSEGTQAVIVLHACETGKGENSIAQQLSEHLPNTVIIAPDENVAVTLNQEELGAYRTKEIVKNDEKGNEVKTLQTDKVGAWVMFRGGEKIGSFNGATKPNASKPEQFHLNNQ